MDPRPQLSKAERAELCSRVDLLAVLAADGVAVKKSGGKYVCSLRREDKTPSCHVWPPGSGRKGGDGWTMKDYGDGWGGDALAYLVDRRGLSFVDAVAELCRLSGFTPEGWKNLPPGCPRNASKPVAHTVTPPQNYAPATMDPEAQAAAVAAFLHGLADLHPEARAEGDAYLASRGTLPPSWPPGICYRLPADLCGPLAERLAAGPDAERLLEAGLLKPAEDGKPLRLPWWGDVVLFACRDAEAWPVYLVGRRMDWQAGDRWGKYINQPTAAGAVRWPFNLPAMYAAARRLPNWPWTPAKDRAGDLLLVEGPTDALGAAVLGWAAVALLTRPQAAGPEDRRSGACKMLEAHLPALRSLRLVRVVPDADPGPKGAEGEALAAKLVAWLRAAGIRAEVSTLPELLPDLPPECKDLADAAKNLKGCLP